METHETDPTGKATSEPWERVHDQIGELGGRLKETYRNVADEKGPTEEEIRQALNTLAGVWEQVSTSMSDVLRDPELRRRLKATAASLAAALGDTIGGVGREMGQDAGEEE